MGWDEVIKTTNCKIRAFTSVSSDVGRTIQILKDNIVVASGVYTSNLFLDFELAGKTKYTVKDLTSGYSQNIKMDAGSYEEVETGLTTTTWEGIIRIIKAGRALEFLETGDVFTVTMQDQTTVDFAIAGINTYGLNEVDFVSKSTTPNIVAFNAYTSLTAYVKPLTDTLFSGFPAYLQNAMSVKPLAYQDSLGNAAYKSYTPNWKVWVPSLVEMGGIYAFETTNGHKPYPLFVNDVSRLFANKNAGAVWIGLATCTGSSTVVTNAAINIAAGYLQSGLQGSFPIVYGFRIKP